MSSFDRFVLIDDNEADNVFHEIMIRRAGFTGEILVFDNGVDAVNWFSDHPDMLRTCIFLDINMPMMDGFEVAEKATPLVKNRPGVKLLMLTSSDSPADRQRALSLPVIQDYLIKPLSAERVQRLMTSAST